jgi:hypothetical protein
MSLPDFATLTIDVRARRAERLLGMVALTGVAMTAVLLLSVSMMLAFAVLVLGLGATAFGLRSQGWLGGAGGLTSISWLADGRWLLSDGCHTNQPAELRGDSRVGSRWVWLRWQLLSSPSKSRSMLLLDGDIPAADLRRLIVRLRLPSQRRHQLFAEAPGA